LIRGSFNIKAAGAKGDGSNADEGAYTGCITAGFAVVDVTPGTYRISANTTLNAISTLFRPAPGAMFKPDSGKTLTISGSFDAIEAGHWQIFDTSAGGHIILNKACARASLFWFGACDRTAAVNCNAVFQAWATCLYQSALAATNPTVIPAVTMPEGAYLVNGNMIVLYPWMKFRSDGLVLLYAPTQNTILFRCKNDATVVGQQQSLYNGFFLDGQNGRIVLLGDSTSGGVALKQGNADGSGGETTYGSGSTVYNCFNSGTRNVCISSFESGLIYTNNNNFLTRHENLTMIGVKYPFSDTGQTMTNSGEKHSVIGGSWGGAAGGIGINAIGDNVVGHEIEFFDFSLDGHDQPIVFGTNAKGWRVCFHGGHIELFGSTAIPSYALSISNFGSATSQPEVAMENCSILCKTRSGLTGTAPARQLFTGFQLVRLTDVGINFSAAPNGDRPQDYRLCDNNVTLLRQGLRYTSSNGIVLSDNLCLNFDPYTDDVANWPASAGSRTRDTSYFYGGTGSIKLAASTQISNAQKFAVVPGNSYQAGWAMNFVECVGQANCQVNASISWYKQDGTTLISTTNPNGNSYTTGTDYHGVDSWHPSTVGAGGIQLKAPAGAAWATVNLISGATIGANARVTNIVVNQIN
jgi:hypothetical protein